jgi:ribosomal protein S18 acetylase RimI-like enzyme
MMEPAETSHPDLAVRSRTPHGPNPFALTPISLGDEAMEYCLALAHENMQPYLGRRGQKFDETRWRSLAPRATFYLITDTLNNDTVGFVSTRFADNRTDAFHIGDVQIQARHQGRGAGSAALKLIEAIARDRGMIEITLNVFHENPARALYERSGFRALDVSADKWAMRKALVLRQHSDTAQEIN